MIKKIPPTDIVLPVTKYVAYNETNSDDGSTRVVVVPRERAIIEQHKAIILQFKRYPDDNTALWDFMLKHSAWTCDREDGRMDDD
jgi:hypothetical protein